ncbi:sulfotransferase domain-containing protein [Aquabacter sp. L1I39]|uniref:sulfotransferase domain-containing protein n=1 Tax=Aquabacter sp. L1I39 TaxID=2820278 RepID=UPI001ADD3E89|nr:sulfotransferase domain-containing protein [Aquabacter sp. L1I39]QTL05288.1 sulfotransferase domain-containing protein [Aquabacter sp. L1I39]
MVSFTRKVHRAWSAVKWGQSRRHEAGNQGAFLGGIGDCEEGILQPAIIVQSHRRSGTHFLIDTLLQNFQVARDWFQLEEDFFSRLGRMPVVLKSHERHFGEKTHSRDPWHSYLHWVAATACYSSAFHLHIVRNPRDVLRSQYYFDRKGHEPRHQIAPTLSFTDYLASPSSRDPEGRLTPPAYWCAHVSAWGRRSDVLHLRYEEMCLDMPGQLGRISAFIGLPVLHRRWLPSTAIGRNTSERQSQLCAADWGPAEEALLQAAAAGFDLPRLGYGLETEGQIPPLPVPQHRRYQPAAVSMIRPTPAYAAQMDI